ncbi:MAG: hypothetical protein J0I24_09575 [Thiomonas arsenitoxydans]|uniref:Uncharacterized protein n=1 Tax=Thiomonas arsenitoxydans (strain DSM 22701 / CIP 110005 / 3As) TaxID=426114 RepID=A0A8I1MY99_THIA3|nr:hypothetical protein [Thiomonas arsenitoxydans]MBN8744544.1 hypothetical protein [Thiomonas arsenitoxydans]
MTTAAIAAALQQLKDFNSRDFTTAMTAALTHQAAQFSFPVISPSAGGDGYDLCAVQRLTLSAGKHCGAVQTTQVGYVPAGAFALAGHFPSFYNRIGASGQAPQADLPIAGLMGHVVVTQSAASALAINSGGLAGTSLLPRLTHSTSARSRCGRRSRARAW